MRRYTTTALVLGSGLAASTLLVPGAGADSTTTAGETTTSQQVTLTVTPNTPKTGSTATLSASNVPAQGTSLPQSITATFPRFSTATAKGVADSVSVLCTSAQASSQSCPATSRVGSGSATIVATLKPAYQAFNPGPITATLASYLEAPTQAGAVADVALTFSSKRGNQTLNGYLESTSAGLTLSVPDLSSLNSQFASYQSYIQSVNLQSLSLTLGAHRTISTVTSKKVKEKVRKTVNKRVKTRVKKNGKYDVRYVTKRVRETVTKTVIKKTKTKSTVYLLINPSTCTTAGWTGSLVLSYASGSPTTLSSTANCSS